MPPKINTFVWPARHWQLPRTTIEGEERRRGKGEEEEDAGGVMRGYGNMAMLLYASRDCLGCQLSAIDWSS